MNSDDWKSSLSYSVYVRKLEKRKSLNKAVKAINNLDEHVSESYLNELKPLTYEKEKTHAEVKELKQEKKLLFRHLKQDYHNKLSELKEESTLRISEAKREVELERLKIKLSYDRVLRTYEANQVDEQSDLPKDKKTFVKAFKVYKKDKEQEFKQSLEEKITYIKNDVLMKKEQIEKHHHIACSEKKSFYADKTYEHDGKPCGYIKKQVLTEKEKIKQLTIEIDKLKKNKHLFLEPFQSERDYLLKCYQEEKQKYKIYLKEYNKQIKVAQIKDKNTNPVMQQEVAKYIRQNEKMHYLKKADQIESKVFKRVNTAYIYIFPAALGALFFTVLPFIFMLIASLFKVNLSILSRSKFVGLDNFMSIFNYDTEFQKALSNTLIYAFVTVVLLIIVVIAMAAWLARNTKIHNFAQTMIFTPHIASLVAISILWIAMLNPTGIINQGLALFGIKGPGWLIQENTSLISVSFVTIWKDIGYYVLIIISGLQAIPAYIYEAAKLDKASKAKSFFSMTLPLLTPTLSFVFVTKFIASFKVFAPIEIMTNGGPMGSSMVLSYWIYKVGRIGFNYGNAMAGAVVLTILIGSFTFINYRFFKKQVVY
jgi:sn-glycerol 3-phosphate transport system permease protein